MGKSAAAETFFSDQIDKSIFLNLEKNRRDIKMLLDNLQRSFYNLHISIVRSRSFIAICNGRVDQASIELSIRIVERAEKDLFDLADDIENLKNTLEEINLIENRLKQSSTAEAKSLSIEKYLQSDSEKATEKISINQNLKQLNADSRVLQHSINALLDLKAGK